MVESISLTSITTGVDGIIIEVPPDPVKAYPSRPQSLNLAKFLTLCKSSDPSPNWLGEPSSYASNSLYSYRMGCPRIIIKNQISSKVEETIYPFNIAIKSRPDAEW